MKKLLFAMVLLSSVSAFADSAICGKFVISEDAYEGRPANEFLGVPKTISTWTKYYLKPRGRDLRSQEQLLRSLVDGKHYCVTGDSYWCGEENTDRCLTIKWVR